MRAILSQISGRARECVFATDPKPEDLWRVVRLDRIDDARRRVFMAFGGDAESGSVDVKLIASGRVVLENLKTHPDLELTRYRSHQGTNTLFGVALPLAHAAGLRSFENLAEEHIKDSKKWLEWWINFYCPWANYPPR